MISDEMTKRMSEQVTKEFYSAYLYLSMASYFESEDLPGFAHWMRLQAQEESCHALIFFNYVSEQGAKVELGAIDKPPADFDSAQDVFEKTLAHEQLVTASVNALMDLAIEEHDHASRSRINWFVDEQVEEEANASQILARLKRIREDSNALLMMDKELGARVFALPSPLATGA